MSQTQEKGHAAVLFRSVGMHLVALRDTYAVPYDFVFRFVPITQPMEPYASCFVPVTQPMEPYSSL
jgi:hypothetical protein